MKTKQIMRQGDVLIMRVTEKPTGTKQPTNEPIILAYGEATGHHHLLERDTPDAADWWKKGNEQFIEVKTPTRITHQEHAPIYLDVGTYRVRRQREYTPTAIRNVTD